MSYISATTETCNAIYIPFKVRFLDSQSKYNLWFYTRLRAVSRDYTRNHSITLSLPSLASSVFRLVMRRYRGLSGQNGITIKVNVAGMTLNANIRGHKSSVPVEKQPSSIRCNGTPDQYAWNVLLFNWIQEKHTVMQIHLSKLFAVIIAQNTRIYFSR